MLQHVARRVAGVQVSDRGASAMLESKHSRRVISMMMFGFVALQMVGDLRRLQRRSLLRDMR
jgi:hypothetical protein